MADQPGNHDTVLDVEEEETVSEIDDLDNAESKHRTTMRQQEWGQQFDMWLIRAARKKLVVEICLKIPYPGVSREGNIVQCVPVRVDKYMAQVLVDNAEVWLNKRWFVGCKPLAAKVRPLAEGVSEESTAK